MGDSKERRRRMADPISPNGAVFLPVSRALTWVRLLAVFLCTLVPVVIVGVAAVMLNTWLWFFALPFALVCVWSLWFIPRQVKAMGWAEGSSDFLIRKGIMFRRLTVVPYGRIQYVDVVQGPIARRFSIATITLHTASPRTSGALDGVPAAEAARLRDMLAQRGNAEMAGL